VLRMGHSPDPSSTRHSRPQIHKDNSYITKRAPYRGKPAANLRRESRAVTLRGPGPRGVRPVQTIKETPTTTKERATASIRLSSTDRAAESAARSEGIP
jgi:hypothetical protein